MVSCDSVRRWYVVLIIYGSCWCDPGLLCDVLYQLSLVDGSVL